MEDHARVASPSIIQRSSVSVRIAPQSVATTAYWYPFHVDQIRDQDLNQLLIRDSHNALNGSSVIDQLEQQFAAYLSAEEAVFFSSSSAAALLTAHCLAGPAEHRLRPGDEVLVPIIASPTTFGAAIMAGLKVVPVDCDPHTFSVDLEDLRWKMSRRTRAIFAVHLLGNPAPIEQLQRFAEDRDLLLVESCESALGCRYGGRLVGSYGFASIFQLRQCHPRFGNGGGMITCQSKTIANHLRVMRSEGWANDNPIGYSHRRRCDLDPRSLILNWGFDARPSAFQAELGLNELERLTETSRRRQEIAREFYDYISRCPNLRGPEVIESAEPIWDVLPIQVEGVLQSKRRQLMSELENAGIETRPIVAGSMARQPVSHWLGSWQPEDFPGAEAIHRTAFCIGLSPLADATVLRRLIETFESCVSRVSSTVTTSVKMPTKKAA